MSEGLSPRAAHLGMLLWAVLVGLSFPAVRVMSELPPFSLTSLRFFIACGGLWWLARRSPFFLPRWRQLPLYSLMGLCLAGFFGAMFWAAHHATALSMATLFVTVPLLAFLLGLGFGVERLAWRLPAILALGATGALGLAFAESVGQAGRLQFGIGEAVFFLGCLSTALYPVLSKWGLATGRLPASAAVRTFWSLGLGAVLIGLLGLAVEPVAGLASMTGRDLWLLLFLGLLSTALTFWLLQRATAVLTPGAVTAYSYLVPFVSMLLLFVREPERIGWVWLPGSLLVIVAIALLLRNGRAAG
ncbi:drug/metabolite transporter (DMT)-like permease [Halomonas fontilapidosi]|uniref:Drug/metabolite transporter (DMT)-like permease n=1 Tax=Halomonas fontilapidosi TaxID=616675 RepID=A0A7W5DMU4_9GAMM|nr:DMT family transporter [Halomonas fontilapidosi]MBB3185505.1 drug/metabolite transporter (DMT)-like permease [Halomonas fontilapidosi]